MWKSELYTIFQQLRSQKKEEGRYEVETISTQLSHKLGSTTDGRPIFFVECCDVTRQVDIKLSLFTVMYNRPCDIYDNSTGENYVRTYTVIQLNSDDEEFQKYFLDVIYMILLRLPAKPDTTELDSEIKKIITLFTNAKRPLKSAIRGLFAELVVIDLAKNPKYLLQSWHVHPNDPFDFNDGKDKVEVKSCTKDLRKHTFSLEQLYTTEDSNLVIASIAVLQTGMGVTIYDLVDSITLKVQDDINLVIHLRECVASTIGNYFNEVSEYKFDYGVSEESYTIYNSQTVPKIDKTTIPSEITNVHFSVDFTDIIPVESDSYDSKLIKALL